MHATLTDMIADTAQNSIEAGAKLITVELVEDGREIAVKIVDNGKGMSEAVQRRVFDPFYTEPGKHDARKVGLGLPILKQMCEDCEGGLELNSQVGCGTTLAYHFNAHNIDLPPMGEVVEMVLGLFNYPGDFDLVFTHRKLTDEYTIARSELVDAVGSIETIDGLSLAREFLASQESSLPQV